MTNEEKRSSAELHPALDGDKDCIGYGWVTGLQYEESDNMWHTTIHCNRIGYVNAIIGLPSNCDHIYADRCEKCAFRKPKQSGRTRRERL